MHPRVPKISVACLNKHKGRKTPMMIAFISPGCGHCHKLYETMLVNAALQLPDKIKVGIVNVAKHNKELTEYEIRTVPTIYGFTASGKVVKYDRPRTIDDLKSFAMSLSS